MSRERILPMPVEEIRLLMQGPLVDETDEFRKVEMGRIFDRVCSIRGDLEMRIQSDRAFLDDLTPTYDDAGYSVEIANRSSNQIFLKDLLEAVAHGLFNQIRHTNDKLLIEGAKSSVIRLRTTFKNGGAYSEKMVDPLVKDMMGIDYGHDYLDLAA